MIVLVRKLAEGAAFLGAGLMGLVQQPSLPNGEACTSDSQCTSNNCHEEGAVDKCRPSTCDSSDNPNDGEFCDPSVCGPCLITEGDCDSDSECEGSLMCHEEGVVDKCRASTCTNSDDLNDGEFCDVGVCGPCGENEGDCDSDNECKGALECVENGTVDYCDVGSSSGSGTVTHVGSTKEYQCSGSSINLSKPSGTQEDDVLLLILQRTDGDMPIKEALSGSGWTYVGMVASCNNCGGGTTVRAHEENDCTSWHVTDEYCATYRLDGTGKSFDGHDLNQAVFYRVAGASEPSSYSIPITRGTSTRMIGFLSAFRGADTANPVSPGNGFTTDGFNDGTPRAEFPSVYGVDGGYLLLSMTNDDGPSTGADCGDYGAPSGTTELICQQADSNSCHKDELGKLYGKQLSADGPTPIMTTTGSYDENKDIKISLVINPA